MSMVTKCNVESTTPPGKQYVNWSTADLSVAMTHWQYTASKSSTKS